MHSASAKSCEKSSSKKIRNQRSAVRPKLFTTMHFLDVLHWRKSCSAIGINTIDSKTKDGFLMLQKYYLLKLFQKELKRLKKSNLKICIFYRLLYQAALPKLEAMRFKVAKSLLRSFLSKILNQNRLRTMHLMGATISNKSFLRTMISCVNLEI